VSDWLERLRSLVRTQDRAPDTAQSRRVEAVLPDLERAGAVLVDETIDPRTLEVLVAALKTPGFYGDLTETEVEAHLGFWRRLAERHPTDAVLAAHLADVEMALGNPEVQAAAMARFVDAFDRKPELFFEFGWDLEEEAREVGGEVLFRWQLQLLRWFLQAAADHLESGDEAREIYGGMLDEYREDPARLAALRPLGEEIHRLEVAGDLPRAMVVRRRRTT